MKPDPQSLVRLDLNNPVFQQNLLSLQKPERHSALETLAKLLRMTGSSRSRPETPADSAAPARWWSSPASRSCWCPAQVPGGVECVPHRRLRRQPILWAQVYSDNGLKWEKIVSVAPPPGIAAIYSLRIAQSRRATAYRDGDFLRLLTIASGHDATYGKK